MEFCSRKSKATSCLNCPVEGIEKPLDCQKYFGSDHLKYKRMKKFRCKSKRIRLLAQPKHYTPKYVEPEVKPIKRSIEITRDEELSTRIKMLAFPKVRKLVASFDEYKRIVNQEKLMNLNQHIEKSMMTMYSRLANVHVCDKKPQRRKWTKSDWQKHCEWLKKRACPRKLPKVKAPKRKIISLRDMEVSVYRLAQPRNPRPKYRPNYGYQSVVKDTCKQYVPTQRIVKLAEPKKLIIEDDMELEAESFYANPNALTYNATSRIKELATPKSAPKVPFQDIPEFTEFGVVKRALKASLSERTIELSKPKMKDDDDDEEKPLVNPKALKAKPTPRILELAKPRVFPQ